MSDSFYTAASTVTKVSGVHRRATLPVGEPVEFGVHGAIKEHFRLHDSPDLPLPVDYIVAATGG